MLESIRKCLSNKSYQVEVKSKIRGISGIVHEFTMCIMKNNVRIAYLDTVVDSEGLLLSYCKAIDLEKPVIIIAPMRQLKMYGFSSGTRIRNIIILSRENPDLLRALVDIIEKL